MTTQEILEAARGAKAALALADGAARAQALHSMTAQLCSPASMTAILAANADDMAAAKMPETTRPHMKEGSIICASTMKIFSAAEFVRNSVGSTARPIRPIATAQNSEITTQTTAITRDFLISSEFLTDMKRTSTCGIPK